jgi:osmotically-inducible protein OsmY
VRNGTDISRPMIHTYNQTEIAMIQWKHFSVPGAALILGVTVSAWAVAGSSATARGPDDAGITAEVKSAIAQRRDLQAPNQIYVETHDHVVYLSGEVYSSLSGDDATEIARKVPGVLQVVSTIWADE